MVRILDMESAILFLFPGSTINYCVTGISHLFILAPSKTKGMGKIISKILI